MSVIARKRSSVRAAARRRTHGFTLIEMMIVCAVIAILAVLAYPSYTAYIVRTSRKAAEACLSEYANYMERYYTTNLRYDQDTSAVANTLPTLDCAASNQTGKKYAYSFLSAPTANAYTVRAVPMGIQATGDTTCGTLAVDQAGTRSASGSGGVANCW